MVVFLQQLRPQQVV